MHEAVEIVDPIVEFVVGVFGIVVRLSRTTRKAVGSVVSAGYVDELELEGEDGYDPAIDASGRRDVRIRQHTFDVPRIDFDDEVSNANEVEAERAKSSEETVEFELGLGESRFALVEGDGSEAVVESNLRVVRSALGEDVADGDVRGVDGEDDWGRGSVVDCAKRG